MKKLWASFLSVFSEIPIMWRVPLVILGAPIAILLGCAYIMFTFLNPFMWMAAVAFFLEEVFDRSKQP